MAEKSRDAFRTISEVAEWLDVPTHVLRFWESRFAQIKPVKRAGGRRYYRPSDMRVIGGVKVLLHDQGMTIRGVQKLFREEGIKHVSGYSPALFDEDEEFLEAEPLDAEALERAAQPAPVARSTRTAARTLEETGDEADKPEKTPEGTAPMFRSAKRTAETAPRPASPAEAETDEPELDFQPSDLDEEVPASLPIPPTPDVPDTDPQDDDPDHDVGPGHAARLRKLPRSRIMAERPRVEAAVARLKAVLDRSA